MTFLRSAFKEMVLMSLLYVKRDPRGDANLTGLCIDLLNQPSYHEPIRLRIPRHAMNS